MRSGYQCSWFSPCEVTLAFWAFWTDLNDSPSHSFQVLETIHSSPSAGPGDDYAHVLAPILLFPQHSTHSFITNPFINKSSSIYSNLSVPSVTWRNSTWYTLIYRKRSWVPQEKGPKILYHHDILLKILNIHDTHWLFNCVQKWIN